MNAYLLRYIRLTHDEWAMFTERCNRMGHSRSTVVAKLIRAFLEHKVCEEHLDDNLKEK